MKGFKGGYSEGHEDQGVVPLKGTKWNLSDHGCLKRVSVTGRSWEVVQIPRLGRPSQGKEEKLGIELPQLDEDLGEELMKLEGVRPQGLPWQRYRVSTGWELGLPPSRKETHWGEPQGQNRNLVIS